jgi:hypothetical protein
MLNSFDQFAARDFYSEVCDALREIQEQHQVKVVERALRAPGPDGLTRPTLAALAGSDKSASSTTSGCRTPGVGNESVTLAVGTPPAIDSEARGD